MTFFSEKNSIFTAKISDDLFLVVDQVFWIFPFFSVSFAMSYMTLSSQEQPLFLKKFLYDTFLLCSYFRAHPTTLLLKILGDECMGRPPTSNYLGGPFPLGLRPYSERCHYGLHNCMVHNHSIEGHQYGPWFIPQIYFRRDVLFS